MAFTTVGEAIQWAEQAFIDADLFYGHGTDNAWDDAVVLILTLLDYSLNADKAILQDELTEKQQQLIMEKAQQRITQRLPVPYLTHEAWFCGLPFYVDERVIIPRSPFAELIQQQFTPWIEPNTVHRILDLCCGSACIAVACAYAFPEAQVDAIDLSAEALAVAEINRQKHQLEARLRLLSSDLFNSLNDEKYDIIVSNPPYVDEQDFETMPQEFSHEPTMALTSGDDGLKHTRQILAQAAQYLNPKGILLVEVGNSAAALLATFPQVPFTWLEFNNGGDGVFLLSAEQLQEYQHVFSRG